MIYIYIYIKLCISKWHRHSAFYIGTQHNRVSGVNIIGFPMIFSIQNCLPMDYIFCGLENNAGRFNQD